MELVVELIAQLRRPSTADAAVEGLYSLGEAAIDALLAAMLDPSEDARARELCAEAIGRATPRGPVELLRCLRECEDNEADLAAWGLRWSYNPERIESALHAMLTESEIAPRRRAARALRYIHVDLRRCDPRLVAAARDPDPQVRSSALQVLIELADVQHFAITDPRELLEAAKHAMQSTYAEERALGTALFERLRVDR